MLLIPREELLFAAVEGNMIFWAGVVILCLLWRVVSEACEFTWDSYKRWRDERTKARGYR